MAKDLGIASMWRPNRGVLKNRDRPITIVDTVTRTHEDLPAFRVKWFTMHVIYMWKRVVSKHIGYKMDST